MIELGHEVKLIAPHGSGSSHDSTRPEARNGLRVSKAGQADIRRLLIIGAMARLNWLGRKSIAEGSWLARMLARKPRMLMAIALGRVDELTQVSV